MVVLETVRGGEVKRTIAMAIALAMLALLAGAALADINCKASQKACTGNNKAKTIYGSNSADKIFAKNGSDEVLAEGGPRGET
jgi:hypothetical protein